tara:strand:- start:197 stop:778 length:582 start_codon:yes stop_codon:yes gene_type:complete
MSYRIKQESSFTTIIKKSKFIGYSFFIKEKKQVKLIIENLKKKHKKANHFCYAYKIEKESYCNDDGEPKNSAGKPILNQINSKKLTSILIVVVRFFGGKKLGIQGLIKAYKDCSLETIKISNKTLYETEDIYSIKFKYIHTNTLEIILKKENIKVNKKIISNKCEYIIETKKLNIEKIRSNKIFLVKKILCDI